MRIVDASLSNYVKQLIKEYLKKNESVDIDIVSSTDNLDMVIDYIELDEPDVLIISKDIDDSPQGENIIKTIKTIRQTNPLVRCVLLAQKYNKRFFQKIVNLGIYSIVLFDDIEENLIKEILEPSQEFDFEKYEVKSEKRQYINKITKGLKRVIAVYSPSPTGKSYIISNLAYILAQQKIKTVLVDGDLTNRSLSYYYYLDKPKDIELKKILEGDKTLKSHDIGYSFLDGWLKVISCKRLSEDLKDIPIGLNIEEKRKIPDNFMNLIDYLRAEAEVVFIDVNRNIDDEITKRVLKLADTVLFVQNLDYRMMDISKASLRRLNKENISLKKFVLIVNRFIENKEFTQKKIEKFFESNFAGRVTVPEDSLSAIKQIRYGKPAVAFKECKEEVVEAFYQLSKFCYGIEKIEKRKGGFLSNLLSRNL